MLPGIPEHVILFSTSTDRKLFNAAATLAHERNLPLVDALRIAYGIAADLAPGLEHLDYGHGDAELYIGKGVLSPFVAVLAAQNQHTGPDVPMVACHVWLRTTLGVSGYSDSNYCVGNGRPGGKGGSYKATVVSPVDFAHSYDVAVTVEPCACRVTKQWLDAWHEFTQSLSC